MTLHEALYPSAARLSELCTNGLFLRLSGCPEPIYSTYQQLRVRILEEALPGAVLALSELADYCVRFPLLIACRAILSSPADLRFKQDFFSSFPSTSGLLSAAETFLADHPDDTASAFWEASKAAHSLFTERGLFDWASRTTSGAYLEMARPETASELITYLSVANGYLSRYLPLFSQLKPDPESDALVYSFRGKTLEGAPFLKKNGHDVLLAEAYDPLSEKMLYRSAMSYQVLFDDVSLPEALSGIPVPAFPRLSLGDELRAVHSASDYLRPVYWDHWLSASLTKLPKGYLLLEAESGMGKTVYTHLLDPASPYYLPAAFLDGYAVYRYQVTLSPDTKRPSFFTASLSALAPDLPPIQWTEEPADLARRTAAFLEKLAAKAAPKKLLFIVDGIHALPFPEQGSLSILGLLPDASELPDGAHILLTDRHELGAASHRPWLHRKDPNASIGTFSKDHPQFQRLLRIYITQYVLHLNAEDNPLVFSLLQKLSGSLTLAHTLRDVFYLCRPDAHTTVERLLDRAPSREALLGMYLERLHMLYGPKYGHMVDDLLMTLAILPHPATAGELEHLLPGHPHPTVLFSILRDLTPFLQMTDGGHVDFATEDTHMLVLSLLPSAWRAVAGNILKERRDLLVSAKDPYADPLRLKDLDYYASLLLPTQEESLYADLVNALAPSETRTEPLPRSVTELFRYIEDFYPEEAENPYRMQMMAAFSLSDRPEDRLSACRREESLKGSPYFDADVYHIYCRRYEELLSRTDPLSKETVTQLASFHRKTDNPWYDAFLWHPEKLSRQSLFLALKKGRSDEGQDPSDPTDLGMVRTRLPQLVQKCEDSLGADLPQEAAVSSHHLMVFCETMLLAMLPVVCARESQPEAGEFFAFIRGTLARVYSLRQHLFMQIDAYGDAVRPERDYRLPLYAPEPQEIRRRRYLSRDFFLWADTFQKRQLLQFFPDNSPLWRVLEADIRLSEASSKTSGQTPVNLRTVKNQISELSDSGALEEAYALSDRYVETLLQNMSSVRGPLIASRFGDYSTALLIRAELISGIVGASDAPEGEKTAPAGSGLSSAEGSFPGRQALIETLHADVVRLRFLFFHGDLPTRRRIDTAGALGGLLLAEDSLLVYPSAAALTEDYTQFNNVLQRGHSFFSNKQIDAVQDAFRSGFTACLKRHRFYGYLIPTQSKIDALESGPLGCRMKVDETSDPLSHLIALEALVFASPDKSGPRAELLDWLQRYVASEGAFAPAALLDYAVTRGLELLRLYPQAKPAFSVPFYARWKHLGSPELAEAGLDGKIPSSERALYRRVSGCFLVEGAPILPEKLLARVREEDPIPLHRAFDLLCLAIAAGSRSFPSARRLTELAGEELRAAAVSQPLEFTDDPALLRALDVTRIMSLCLDERASLEALPGLIRDFKAHSEASGLPSDRLPFGTYCRLWNTRLASVVPPELTDALSASDIPQA